MGITGGFACIHNPCEFQIEGSLAPPALSDSGAANLFGFFNLKKAHPVFAAPVLAGRPELPLQWPLGILRG